MLKTKKGKIEVSEASPKWALNTVDWTKIGKGALIAAGGAVLTYLAETIPGVDFGEYTLIVAPILMILINAGIKWIQGQR